MGRTRPFIVPVCVDDTPETDADVPDVVLRRSMDSLAQRGGATGLRRARVAAAVARSGSCPGRGQVAVDPAVPPTGAAPRLTAPSPAALRPTPRVSSDRGSRGDRRRLLCARQVVAVEEDCSTCADLVTDYSGRHAPTGCDPGEVRRGTAVYRHEREEGPGVLLGRIERGTH